MANDSAGRTYRQTGSADGRRNLLMDVVAESDAGIARKELHVGMAHHARLWPAYGWRFFFDGYPEGGVATGAVVDRLPQFMPAFWRQDIVGIHPEYPVGRRLRQ